VEIYDADQIPNTQVLRLFGLGYDALSYINPEQPFIGLTGTLQTDTQGLIRRSLPIVTIRNGKPE